MYLSIKAQPLPSTRGVGIKYVRTGEALSINTYVDAGYGVDKKRGRSITGYVLHVAGGAAVWRSHLQPTVADSPNTAEYIGLHEAAVTSMGILNLLAGMGHETGPHTLREENDGCRKLALVGMGQKKARHLEVKYHYVQELCGKGAIRVTRIETKNQPADLLTKGRHSCKEHAHLMGSRGVCDTSQ